MSILFLGMAEVAECVYKFRRPVPYFQRDNTLLVQWLFILPRIAPVILFDSINEDPQFCSWRIPKSGPIQQLLLVYYVPCYMLCTAQGLQNVNSPSDWKRLAHLRVILKLGTYLTST
jgi:hypothetical protein